MACITQSFQRQTKMSKLAENILKGKGGIVDRLLWCIITHHEQALGIIAEFLPYATCELVESNKKDFVVAIHIVEGQEPIRYRFLTEIKDHSRSWIYKIEIV